MVARSKPVDPPLPPLEKEQPVGPAPGVGAPLPVVDDGTVHSTDPSASAFTPTGLPRAPVVSAPAPFVSRNNPFGPEFFAEVDDPPAPPDPATAQALTDTLFSGGTIAHLEAADVTRLLSYLRQD